MPIVDDAKQTVQRFSQYIQQFVELFKRFKLNGSGGVRGLWRGISNREFREESNKIWSKVADQEGGKLTLTTVATIIGAALGSIGVAGVGSAIGIPLIVLLPPFGYFVGAEVDSWGLVRRVKAYLVGTSEPTSDSEDGVAEVEQLTELVASLLVRCEQAETAARQADERASALGKRIAEFEDNASASQAELANLGKRVGQLIWIGSTLAIVTAILMCLLFVRR